MARRRRSERARGRAMAAFVEALEQGAHVVAAAQAAGVHVSTPYRWRRDVAGFAAAWEEAVALSARPVLIAAANKRALQKRRTRRVRFNRERKERFLAHFARTCDATAAAGAAGVCADTVHKHLERDAAFAEGWQAALEIGHQLLRAELVAQQRAAQERYRVSPGCARDERGGAAGLDFDRGLKLLDSWQRRDGSVGRRAPKRGDARMRWSFDRAIAELDRQLKALVERSGGPEGTDPPLRRHSNDASIAGTFGRLRPPTRCAGGPLPLPRGGEGLQGGEGEGR